MLCKDSGGFCCCAELDPDKQQLWVPCLGQGMKDFLCSLLPYQDSFPGRDLGSGKISLLGVTFNPPCQLFGTLCQSLEPGLCTQPYHKQATCCVPWLALKLWCHIISLHVGSWIRSRISESREMGKYAYQVPGPFHVIYVLLLIQLMIVPCSVPDARTSYIQDRLGFLGIPTKQERKT